jgi:prolyl-tRNA synthetase
MGAIVEASHDENGIVWPRSVSPFDAHLIHIPGSAECASRADKLYQELQDAGYEVLYDDRDARAGEKFSDADLIGIPTRITVSDKNEKLGDKILLEVKDRKSGEVTNVAEDEILLRMSALKNA